MLLPVPVCFHIFSTTAGDFLADANGHHRARTLPDGSSYGVDGVAVNNGGVAYIVSCRTRNT